MTITKLKAKATAGELALIEKVEKLVEKEAATAVLHKAEAFIIASNPLGRGVGGHDPDNFKRWVHAFAAHIMGDSVAPKGMTEKARPRDSFGYSDF